MALLCLDIGNTHVHYGLISASGVSATGYSSSAALDDPVAGLLPRLRPLFAEGPATTKPTIEGLVFCSVVPSLVAPLAEVMGTLSPLPLVQLTHRSVLGLPINYPKPEEIGHDRLANAAAAAALFPGHPVVVIDLGTAVTFDLITPEGGYEGGIITPGPALVTRYLHERTAQLPWVSDLSTPVTSVIGKSTVDAIRIGAVVGYAGMIQALLDAVLTEFAARGLPAAEIILSGGAAAVVEGRLRQTARIIPDLTLLGLAAVWRLNQPPVMVN